MICDESKKNGTKVRHIMMYIKFIIQYIDSYLEKKSEQTLLRLLF